MIEEGILLGLVRMEPGLMVVVPCFGIVRSGRRVISVRVLGVLRRVGKRWVLLGYFALEGNTGEPIGKRVAVVVG